MALVLNWRVELTGEELRGTRDFSILWARDRNVRVFLNSKSPLELMDLKRFLRQYEDHLEYQLQIITRESSVQLIFQFCLIIYQFINLPAIEVTYRNLASSSDYFEGVETVQWLSGLILRIVSIFLSAYSTLSWPLKVCCAVLRKVADLSSTHALSCWALTPRCQVFDFQIMQP